MSLKENGIFIDDLLVKRDVWLEQFNEAGLMIESEGKREYVKVLDDADEHCSATKKVYLPKELTLEFYGFK